MLFFICHGDYKLIIVAREEHLPSSSRFSLHIMMLLEIVVSKKSMSWSFESWDLNQRVKVGSRFAMATMKGLANGRYMMVAKMTTKLLGL